jgi:hypothetical protein
MHFSADSDISELDIGTVTITLPKHIINFEITPRDITRRGVVFTSHLSPAEVLEKLKWSRKEIDRAISYWDCHRESPCCRIPDDIAYGD